ncbi:MAG: hypothetical protein QY318_01200 [Candidatus Dojkabacteria bacterium]|nr:MAG: hypothetical protein QY318_01200 [Candidatus Dojkabacteria bacterium]
MLGCSRLTNLILTIAIGIVLTFMISAAIISYAASEVISDREKVKEAIKDDKVKEDFILYIQDELDKQTDGDLSLIINEDAAQTILDDPTAEEKIDETLDQLVDDTYDWLEGDADEPTIVIGQSDGSDETLLEEEIRDKLGPVGDLINYDELNEASSQFRLYEVKDDQINQIPQLYQTLTGLYKKLLIGIAVLTIVLLLSAQSIRKGAFSLGIVLAASGALVLFTPLYLERSTGTEQTVAEQLDRLPWLVKTVLNESVQTVKEIETPDFVNTFALTLFEDIQEEAALYAKLAIAFGIVLAIGTQLSIRRTEAENDYDTVSQGSGDARQFIGQGGDPSRRVRTMTDDQYDDPRDDIDVDEDPDEELELEEEE